MPVILNARPRPLLLHTIVSHARIVCCICPDSLRTNPIFREPGLVFIFRVREKLRENFFLFSTENSFIPCPRNNSVARDTTSPPISSPRIGANIRRSTRVSLSNFIGAFTFFFFSIPYRGTRSFFFSFFHFGRYSMIS